MVKKEQTDTQIQKVRFGEASTSSTLSIPDGNFIHSDFKHSALRIFANDYAELKQLIKRNELLDKQPAYYTFKILFTMGLLAVGVTFLIVVNNFWLQLLNAVYLAFVFAQISFLGHDIGHRQVFRTTWKIDISSFVIGNLLVGWSGSWWIDKHNRHHGHPNQVDLDPDIDVPFLAFTEEEARGMRGLPRFIVKYQAYFVFPLEMLAALSFLIFSIRFLLEKKPRHVVTEMILMTVHYLLYFGLLFSSLGILQAIVFVTIHRALFGLYLGSVAAPNHKGMLVLDKDSPMDFLRRQVLTSRNVKAHPLTDFWYGGLNYQIEHHLFPTIARNKLKAAQQIVRTFCEAHSIAYYETSVVQSYKEILHFLHEVSAPLREK